MDVCNFICQTSRGDPDSQPLLCFGPNKFAPSPGVTQIDRDWNGPGQVAAQRPVPARSGPTTSLVWFTFQLGQIATTNNLLFVTDERGRHSYKQYVSIGMDRFKKCDL